MANLQLGEGGTPLGVQYYEDGKAKNVGAATILHLYFYPPNAAPAIVREATLGTPSGDDGVVQIITAPYDPINVDGRWEMRGRIFQDGRWIPTVRKAFRVDR